jgi:hypothetical protein
VDIYGKEVIPLIYDGARTFKEGLAPVCLGKQWGYVNQKNEIVIPPE